MKTPAIPVGTKQTLALFITIFTCFIPQAQELALSAGGGILKGILLPAGNPAGTPLVFFISGSGPTDRDGNQPGLENNAIRLLAEALQKEGIASFRYDKRGSGQSISSTPESELTFETYITDAAQWIDYLHRRKKFSKIVVAGHSEGALVGIMASQNNPAVKGYISISGAGKSIDRILEDQLTAQSPSLAAEAAPVIKSLKKGVPVEKIPLALYALFRPSVQPYLISWMKYDPVTEIKKLTRPVLIIQGETDIQVTPGDARALAAAIPGATLKIIPEMNHVLKHCKTTQLFAQQATYIDPDAPVPSMLTGEIVRFIRMLP